MILAHQLSRMMEGIDHRINKTVYFSLVEHVSESVDESMWMPAAGPWRQRDIWERMKREIRK